MSDCFDASANKCGGQHTFVLYGDVDAKGDPLPGTVGVGFAGHVGSEACFHPNRYEAYHKTKAVLAYGKGAGKRAIDATDDEIFDCIKNYPPSKPYDTFSYNCRSWALEAMRSAGLEPDKSLDEILLTQPR